MNFLTQLLPGFRHVRAPLIGGYLWLVVAWLLLRDDLPRPEEAEVYERAAELGNAIGPVALAVVASVAAYLVGSLVKAAITVLGDALVAVQRNKFRRHWTGSLKNPLPLVSLEEAPAFKPNDIYWFDGDKRTKSRMEDLVEKELSESLERITKAREKAEEKVAADRAQAGKSWNSEDFVFTLRHEGKGDLDVAVSAFVVQGSGSEAAKPLSQPVELPAFSADRDIFEERQAIKTLLMERTQQAGSEVERLYSEAELRFYVALPLAAILIVLWAKSGDWTWAFLLAAPIGLLAHAIVLNKHGGLEMVEALRSRNDSEDLQRITTVFSRYRSRAEKLADQIDRCQWSLLVSELELRATRSGSRTPARSGSAGP